MTRPFLMLAVLSLLAACPGLAQPAAPDDRMVEVQGRPTRVRLHGLADRRLGQPIVVFQSGLGSPLEMWGRVPEAVAAFAPVITYDRPGVGESAPAEGALSPVEVTAHLDDLLAAIGAGPPYVMVGHSWGGPLILHFAGAHPEQVAGMVYVDPAYATDSGEFIVSREVLNNLGYDETEQAAVASELGSWLDSMYATASPTIRGEWEMVRSTMEKSVAERGIPAPPAVPTAVLLSARYDPPPPGAPAAFDERFDRAMVQERIQVFQEIVINLPLATLTVVSHAGHYIHEADPQVVVDAVRGVVFPALNPQLAQALDEDGPAGLTAVYRGLKARYPAAEFDERLLNSLGYGLLWSNRLDEAVAVFELNAAEYPETADMWDSLGEAYLARGERDKAAASYRKSLELDPANTNAAKVLEELGGK